MAPHLRALSEKTQKSWWGEEKGKALRGVEEKAREVSWRHCQSKRPNSEQCVASLVVADPLDDQGPQHLT